MTADAAPERRLHPARVPAAARSPSAADAQSRTRPGTPALTAARTVRRRLGWRWAARGLALIAVAITVMMIALGIGMRANDSAIDEHLGTATATVLSVSPLRTGIEFVDATGATIRPGGRRALPGAVDPRPAVRRRVLHPGPADRPGGRPDRGGRHRAIALIAAVTYLIAVPLIWWCLRRSRLPLLGLLAGRIRGPAASRALSTPELGRLPTMERRCVTA